MQRLTPEILDQAVVGHNLSPGSLRRQLGVIPALLVFLRHGG